MSEPMTAPSAEPVYEYVRGKGWLPTSRIFTYFDFKKLSWELRYNAVCRRCSQKIGSHRLKYGDLPDATNARITCRVSGENCEPDCEPDCEW